MPDPILIICPTCSTTNRVPHERLGAGGKCGRCGSALFDAHPVALGALNFEAHLNKSGIPLMVDFWASWCGPCREETPDLQSFYEHNSNRGFAVLGVNQQEKQEAARTFLEEFGVTYPAVLDSSGEVSQAYGVGRGMPISFLITPAGVIDRVIFGAISEDQFDEIEAKLQ